MRRREMTAGLSYRRSRQPALRRSPPMQGHRPTAPSGHQGTFKHLPVRSRLTRRPHEAGSDVLMVCTLARQITCQAAILADDTLDDRSTLEGVESKAILADCHQPLRGRAAGFAFRYNRPDPAALQSVPCENLA